MMRISLDDMWGRYGQNQHFSLLGKKTVQWVDEWRGWRQLLVFPLDFPTEIEWCTSAHHAFLQTAVMDESLYVWSIISCWSHDHHLIHSSSSFQHLLWCWINGDWLQINNILNKRKSHTSHNWKRVIQAVHSDVQFSDRIFNGNVT